MIWKFLDDSPTLLKESTSPTDMCYCCVHGRMFIPLRRYVLFPNQEFRLRIFLSPYRFSFEDFFYSPMKSLHQDFLFKNSLIFPAEAYLETPYVENLSSFTSQVCLRIVCFSQAKSCWRLSHFSKEATFKYIWFKDFYLPSLVALWRYYTQESSFPQLCRFIESSYSRIILSPQ